VTPFDQNATPVVKNEIGTKIESVNATSQIINGHHNGRINTLERPRVTIADPGMNSFRSAGVSGGENVRRFDQSSEMVNGHFGGHVTHRQPPPVRFEMNQDSFEMRENQACSIPGSHERPPPPRYRRSDYIVTERDFDESRRIMTLDRRRVNTGRVTRSLGKKSPKVWKKQPKQLPKTKKAKITSSKLNLKV
jgi:hypothetical protein